MGDAAHDLRPRASQAHRRSSPGASRRSSALGIGLRTRQLGRRSAATPTFRSTSASASAFFATQRGRAARRPALPARAVGAGSPYTLNAELRRVQRRRVVGPRRSAAAPSTAGPRSILDPDHDGVLGDADKCPNEPGPGKPDGCPIKDKDGDGILDNVDKCPNEPETINGYQDRRRLSRTCRTTTATASTTSTTSARTEPEDKDGFQDADGCPDPDNDGDGVPDAKDKCPNVAGPVENAAARTPTPTSDGDRRPARQLPERARHRGEPRLQGEAAGRDHARTSWRSSIRCGSQTGSAKLAKASNAAARQRRPRDARAPRDREGQGRGPHRQRRQAREEPDSCREDARRGGRRLPRRQGRRRRSGSRPSATATPTRSPTTRPPRDASRTAASSSTIVTRE